MRMCYTTLANRRKEREERVELPWLTHQKKKTLSCCSLFTKTGLVKDRQRAYCRPGSMATSLSKRHTHTKDLLSYYAKLW